MEKLRPGTKTPIGTVNQELKLKLRIIYCTSQGGKNYSVSSSSRTLGITSLICHSFEEAWNRIFFFSFFVFSQKEKKKREESVNRREDTFDKMMQLNTSI